MSLMTANDFVPGTVISQIEQDGKWGNSKVIVSTNPQTGYLLLIEAKQLIDVETVEKLFENDNIPFMTMNEAKNCLEVKLGDLVVQDTNAMHSSHNPFANKETPAIFEFKKFHEPDEYTGENQFKKFVRESSIFNWRKEGFLQVMQMTLPIQKLNGTGPMYFTPDHNPQWLAQAKHIGLITE